MKYTKDDDFLSVEWMGNTVVTIKQYPYVFSTAFVFVTGLGKIQQRLSSAVDPGNDSVSRSWIIERNVFEYIS